MAPILYMVPLSPPVRSVLVTAKAIDLQLTEKLVDLANGEQLKPEFLKLNPQHTVPVLDDDGLIISDSQAIVTYLVSKYAKDDSLYPKDLKKRAIVDQRLHFNSGVFFARVLRISRPIALLGKTTIDQQDSDNLIEAYGYVESFLQGKKWIAGDFLSVADYCLGVAVDSISILIPIEEDKFPNIVLWLKKIKELPEWAVNKQGREALENILKTKLRQ